MGTGISWTDETWTPLTGCTRVSPGCNNCYAFQLHDSRHVAWKRGNYPSAAPQYWEPFSQVQLLPYRLKDPLRWRKPKKVFLTSMGDVFHEDVPDTYLDQLFAVMAVCEQHTFQLLTKRPERMRAYMERALMTDPVVQCIKLSRDADEPGHVWSSHMPGGYDWPLPNVWLGTTVEDQQRANERLPVLLDTPAALHWISAEPLLGPVDLRLSAVDLEFVVVGGESGPRYREMDLHWLESVVHQCRDAGVAVWTKQDSGRFPGRQGRIPDELWLHEFPSAALAA